MTVDTPALKEFTQRYEAAWNGRDSSAIEALVTDDVDWYDPALPETIHGPAAVRKFMEDSWRTFPDLRFSEPDTPFLVESGDKVAWAWRMQGTFKGPMENGFAPTGRAMDVLGIDEWHMRDGRIARYRAYYDVMGLAVQLGIMPAPGSSGEKVTIALQKLQARFMNR